MVNALLAGTLVAVIASLIGWFMVVRRQTFAGHTLSVIAFPGAAAAALAGAPAFVGYFGACMAGGLVLSRVSAGGGAGGLSEESAAIGAVQAVALGCGFLFVGLYHGLLNGLDSLLFGTFLGITDGQVLVLAAAAAAVVAVLVAIGRPLFFASVDGEVARRRRRARRPARHRLPVLLGLAVAATSQITGALLVFALLVTPPATAQVLTQRPGLSLALSLAIALAVTWIGLWIAYYSVYPVGFYVTSLSFGAYVLRAGLAGARGALMLGHEFMRNAFLAGTFIALACGLVGYFLVLRTQVFAGDALSHVAFTGALAAAAAGIDLRLGLFAATLAVALGMGAAGDRARADDAVIGSVFAWVLGLGVLFLSIFTTSSSGNGNGAAGVRVLFGSIFGLSAGDAWLAAVIGAATAACAAPDRPAAPVLLGRPGRGRGRRGAGAAARPRVPGAARRGGRRGHAGCRRDAPARACWPRPPAPPTCSARTRGPAWPPRRRSLSARPGSASRSATRSTRCRPARRSSSWPWRPTWRRRSSEGRRRPTIESNA